MKDECTSGKISHEHGLGKIILLKYILLTESKRFSAIPIKIPFHINGANYTKIHTKA